MGGAERIMADLARFYTKCDTTGDVVLLQSSDVEHALGTPGVAVHCLGTLP